MTPAGSRGRPSRRLVVAVRECTDLGVLRGAEGGSESGDLVVLGGESGQRGLPERLELGDLAAGEVIYRSPGAGPAPACGSSVIVDLLAGEYVADAPAMSAA